MVPACAHLGTSLDFNLWLVRGCQQCRAKVRFEKIIREAQDSICAAVTELDGKSFHEDAWTREDGGGGISRVLQVSRLLEGLRRHRQRHANPASCTGFTHIII
jgi:hypothetical protein